MFLFVAAVAAAVYAIGIPLAVAFSTALHSPIQRDAAAKLTCTRCVRRDPSEYATASMRSRYAFLFNGYATDRSGVVVAWEALVMLRKLCVSLAGSILRDPYLQILVALLVLNVSCVATAIIQPYETWWLNLLDTLGLFALIVTQILSIVYFYAETTVDPFMDPDVLEVIVTGFLFLLNAVVFLAFLACFGSELFGLRTKCTARSRVVLKVASPAETATALRAHAADKERNPMHWWVHPTKVAVPSPSEMDDLGVWVWRDADREVAASTTEPELLVQLGDTETLVPDDKFRTMDKATRLLSEIETMLNSDLGGCGSSATADDGGAPIAADDAAWHANDGAVVEMTVRTPASRVVVLAPRNFSFSPPPGAASALDEGSALDEAAGLFYDDYDNPGEVLGPFTTAEFKKWIAKGYFDRSSLVRRTRDGGSIALGTVPGFEVSESEEWFYDDYENSGEMHGPFATAKLQQWMAAGQIESGCFVRRGRDGPPIRLGDALSSVDGYAEPAAPARELGSFEVQRSRSLASSEEDITIFTEASAGHSGI